MLLSHPQHALFLAVSMPTGPAALVCPQHRSRYLLSENLRRPAPQPPPSPGRLPARSLGRRDGPFGASVLSDVETWTDKKSRGTTPRVWQAAMEDVCSSAA